jgi:hypothetical protein
MTELKAIYFNFQLGEDEIIIQLDLIKTIQG